MILSNSSLVQLSAPSTKKTKLSCIETEMGAADKFGSAVEEHAGPLTEDHNECYQLHRHNQTSLELLQSSQANPYTQGEKKGTHSTPKVQPSLFKLLLNHCGFIMHCSTL